MRNSWTSLLLWLVTAAACAQGYKPALPGYKFEFPRDYFNHEEYQTEWWYYTGNLKAADGHRFGFELTFFRQGVAPASNSEPWFVHDLWMAHIALSDVSGQRFYYEERLNRAGPGIAGVNAHDGIVWNGNWQTHIGEHSQELRGIAQNFGFGLTLIPAKRPVIQGHNGVSQKADGLGHSSHYFSLTRLITSGTIDLNGNTYRVDGTSWMDHEFFTGAMATNEIGWDWLSIQLTNGTELMLYRLRHKDGSIDPYSSASFVDATGNSELLSGKDFVMIPATDTWTSPPTKAAYPVRWRLSIPRLKLQLEVTTPLPNQELTATFGPSYWEGAIDASGTRDGSAVQGVGYLEMTGYAEEAGKNVIPM